MYWAWMAPVVAANTFPQTNVAVVTTTILPISAVEQTMVCH